MAKKKPTNRVCWNLKGSLCIDGGEPCDGSWVKVERIGVGVYIDRSGMDGELLLDKKHAEMFARKILAMIGKK